MRFNYDAPAKSHPFSQQSLFSPNVVTCPSEISLTAKSFRPGLSNKSFIACLGSPDTGGCKINVVFVYGLILDSWQCLFSRGVYLQEWWRTIHVSWCPWLGSYHKYWADTLNVLLNNLFSSFTSLEYPVSAPGRWCPHFIVSNSTGFCCQPAGVVCQNWPEERCSRTQVSVWIVICRIYQMMFYMEFVYMD